MLKKTKRDAAQDPAAKRPARPRKVASAGRLEAFLSLSLTDPKIVNQES
jgi:hypothetical protein